MEKDSKTTVAVERTTFAKLDRLAKANSVLMQHLHMIQKKNVMSL